LSNDAARDRLDDALDSLQSQIADIAAMQKKRAALRADAQAAEGTVTVTVNSRGQLVNIVIDESYLDEHDFDELGTHILEAAQAAVGAAGQRTAEMLAPINELDKSFPTFAEMAGDMPDLAGLMPPELAEFIEGAPGKGSSGSSADGGYDDGDDGAEFPTVRR
jgi:DNA-binding protein YbaB